MIKANVNVSIEASRNLIEAQRRRKGWAADVSDQFILTSLVADLIGDTDTLIDDIHNDVHPDETLRSSDIIVST